jgi:hypothetical protein
LSAGLVQDIPQDHVRAFTAKHSGFACALPSGPTTDEGHFAIEPAHDMLLPLL